MSVNKRWPNRSWGAIQPDPYSVAMRTKEGRASFNPPSLNANESNTLNDRSAVNLDALKTYLMIDQIGDFNNITNHVLPSTNRDFEGFTERSGLYTVYSPSNTIYTAPTLGGTWTQRTVTTQGVTSIIFRMHTNNATTIAVGVADGISTAIPLICRSVNGTSFTDIAAPAVNGTTNYTLYDVKYGNGKWLAVGGRESGLSNSFICILSSTDDGLTWSVAYSSNTYLGNFNYLDSIGYSSETGTWITRASKATSSPRILRSTDNGVSWNTVATGNQAGQTVLGYRVNTFYGQGKWICAPNRISEDDGLTWTPIRYFGTIGVKIAFNSNYFLSAGGASNRVNYAPDSTKFIESNDLIGLPLTTNPADSFFGVEWSNLLSRWILLGRDSITTLAPGTPLEPNFETFKTVYELSTQIMV